MGLTCLSCACGITVEEGQIICRSDKECPEGMVCHENERCYSMIEVKSAPDDESATHSETDTWTDGNLDSRQPGFSSDSNTDIHTDSDGDTDTDTGGDADTDTDIDNGWDAGSPTDGDTDTSSETESDTDTAAGQTPD